MKRLASLGLSLFLALGVAGCVAGHKVGGTSLSAHVDDDAVQLNEAHTRTINGVITLNILRARDNWPTGYTTLSGITFSPELQTNANLGLSPLGLGNPVNPFGKSNSSFSRSRASDAKYSVNPFAEKPGASGLYKIEASEELFQRYIDSGWPIEVVFPLFIRRVEIDAPSDAPFNDRSCDIFGDHEFARRLGATFATAAPHRAISDPKTNTSSPACTAVIESIFLGSATTTGGHKKITRWFYEDAHDYACNEDGICRKLNATEKLLRHQPGHAQHAAYACEPMSPTLSVQLIASPSEPLKDRVSALETSTGRKVKITPDGVQLCKEPASDKTLFYLSDDGHLRRAFGAHEFRSFNDMIYFLGETIRNDSFLPVSYCGAQVPLFQVHKGATPFTDHAVEVSHAGEAYWALKKPKPSAECTSERTGTVLSVLSQILLLNQSPEFLEAPESLLER